MDTETARRLSKHMLRLAAETLTTIQNDPDLSRICERGQDPDLGYEELHLLAEEAHALSIISNRQETPKNRGAAVITSALRVHMYAEGYPYEALLCLGSYPNAYAITQMLEGGEPYNASTPEGRATRESVKNALIARCPAFAAEFAKL